MYFEFSGVICVFCSVSSTTTVFFFFQLYAIFISEIGLQTFCGNLLNLQAFYIQFTIYYGTSFN